MASDPQRISFKSAGREIAGALHLPDGFDGGQTYAALAIVTPGSSVKEQIGAVWGSKMAARGFIALAYDPSFQGESGGEPRDLEDPAARVEDVHAAVDYLMTLPFVARSGSVCSASARAAAMRYEPR
ncbi:alpha/beta hydrolase [Sphingomonas sp.]|uniref:alpha/beta hydrolase n=1 Tax=Sphingomonas sp. TaxID=28214 RepID=UPI003B004181